MEINNEIDYRILAAAIVNYRKAETGFIKPYSNVAKALIQMHKMGLKLGIITDAPEIKAWIRLTEMNIQHFFDTGSSQPGKKTPEAQQRALPESHEKPERGP